MSENFWKSLVIFWHGIMHMLINNYMVIIIYVVDLQPQCSVWRRSPNQWTFVSERSL